MNWVVKVVQAEGPRGEQGECLVEEAAVRRGVGAVRREVDGRCVDVGIRADVGDGGQEVVHHARVIGVVNGRPNEATLQDVAPEEGAGQGHVVQMQ